MTQKVQPKVDIITGIRPTASLTIANYLGAVKPIVNLQKDTDKKVLVFVADMHGLTDTEPDVIAQNSKNVMLDYLALGLDPEKTTFYFQSDIGDLVSELTLLLSRHISISELLRVPTLKDKIKKGDRAETANALLALYPVMMAADILIQKAAQVPVGEDQIAHLEVTKLLARRFNKSYGEVFYVPEPYTIKALRILSLKGESKMSKTYPEGAIFLNEDIKKIKKKIKRAETAFAGKMNPTLESHITIAKSLSDDGELVLIDNILKKHMKGEQVMSEFKDVFKEVVVRFIKEFQEKRAVLEKENDLLNSLVQKGTKFARENGNQTLKEVKSALNLNPSL